MHWLLVPEPQDTLTHLSSVEELLASKDYLEAINPKGWLRDNLNVSPTKVLKVSGRERVPSSLFVVYVIYIILMCFLCNSNSYYLINGNNIFTYHHYDL